MNGRIVGQKVAGHSASSRMDFVTDALESIVATADQPRAMVNRYAYKPYGALLAKIGIAPDPAFTWVGSQGYRQTNNKYSDVYVRARHYGSGLGRWTTKDPLGASFDGFCYANANVTNSIDPTGLIAYAAKGCLVKGTCGGVQQARMMYLTGNTTNLCLAAPRKKGYIIQKVEVTLSESHCVASPTDPQSITLTYFEAWPVDLSVLMGQFVGPDYGGFGGFLNSIGSFIQKGTIGFYCESETGHLETAWHSIPQSGTRPAILVPPNPIPNFWINGVGGDGEKSRSVSSNWCCCNGLSTNDVLADPSGPPCAAHQ